MKDDKKIIVEEKLETYIVTAPELRRIFTDKYSAIVYASNLMKTFNNVQFERKEK